MNPIQMVNPAAEYRLMQAELDAAVLGVLASGRYILGPEVERFERNFAEYEEDKKRRLGEAGAQPHRLRYKALK